MWLVGNCAPTSGRYRRPIGPASSAESVCQRHHHETPGSPPARPTATALVGLWLTGRRPYPSSISGARWALIQAHLRRLAADPPRAARHPRPRLPPTCAKSSTSCSISTARESRGETSRTTRGPTAPCTTTPPGATRASTPSSTSTSSAAPEPRRDEHRNRLRHHRHPERENLHQSA